IEGKLDPAGVFVVRDGGLVCGAVLAQALGGALGVLWPPQAESAADAEGLAAAACDWLRPRGVKVCQAFAARDDRPALASLERHGFRRVTQLVFLRRPLDPSRDRPHPDDWLDGVSYHPGVHDRFAAVLV